MSIPENWIQSLRHTFTLELGYCVYKTFYWNNVRGRPPVWELGYCVYETFYEIFGPPDRFADKVLSWATSMEIALHGDTIEDLMRRKRKTWIQESGIAQDTEQGAWRCRWGCGRCFGWRTRWNWRDIYVAHTGGCRDSCKEVALELLHNPATIQTAVHFLKAVQLPPPLVQVWFAPPPPLPPVLRGWGSCQQMQTK